MATISRNTAYVAFIVMLIVGGAIGYLAAPRKEVVKEVEVPVEVPVHPLDGQVIPIGAVVDSTGRMETDPVAMEMALEEVNEYCKKLGYNVEFKLLVENCEGSAVKALEKFESLAARGVKIVLGLGWSAHVEACKAYADEHHILILSRASTAVRLAIPDDFVYRMLPDDRVQSKGIARILIDYGIEHLAILYRKDPWGDGLVEGLTKRYEELGGEILVKVPYITTPLETDFSSHLETLHAAIGPAIEKYGADKVGLQTFVFDEVATIQLQAADYPDTLMAITWFGSDGTAEEEKLIEECPELAAQVKHIATYHGVTSSAKWTRLHEEFYKRTGLTLTSHIVTAYDSMWIAALSVLQAGVYDADVIKEIVPTVCENYFGGHGWYHLNEYGDVAEVPLVIWAIVEKAPGETFTGYSKGVYGWELVGFYDNLADSVNWWYTWD